MTLKIFVWVGCNLNLMKIFKESNLDVINKTDPYKTLQFYNGRMNIRALLHLWPLNNAFCHKQPCVSRLLLWPLWILVSLPEKGCVWRSSLLLPSVVIFHKCINPRKKCLRSNVIGLALCIIVREQFGKVSWENPKHWTWKQLWIHDMSLYRFLRGTSKLGKSDIHRWSWGLQYIKYSCIHVTASFWEHCVWCHWAPGRTQKRWGSPWFMPVDQSTR